MLLISQSSNKDDRGLRRIQAAFLVSPESLLNVCRCAISATAELNQRVTGQRGETTSGTDYACRDLDNENQSPNWRSQVIRVAKGEDKRQPWTFAQVSICFGPKICCSKVPPQTIRQEVIHLCLLVRTHWMSTFHNHNEDNRGHQTGWALYSFHQNIQICFKDGPTVNIFPFFREWYCHFCAFLKCFLHPGKKIKLWKLFGSWFSHQSMDEIW